MSSRRSFVVYLCPGALLWSMPTSHGEVVEPGLSVPGFRQAGRRRKAIAEPRSAALESP
jgi:hypothetical protein